MNVFKITATYGQAAILTVHVVTDAKTASAVDADRIARDMFPNASVIVSERINDVPGSVIAFLPRLTAMAA